MPKSFPVGKAPWETSTSQSFPVGQAPWETPAPSPKPEPDLFGKITGTAQKVTDFLGLHGAVETQGTNLANILYTRLMENTGGPLTTLKENIGAGAQIAASTALPAKAPLSVAKAVSVGALQGAGIGAGKAAAENQSTQDIVQQGATGAAVGGAVSGITALTGRFLERLGEKIQYTVIKPTKADIEDGFHIDTIKKFNLGGSLSTVLTKTEKTMDDLTTQLNDKLAASDQHINLNDVYAKTLSKLQGNKFLSFGSNTQLEGALTQLKNELSAVGTDVTIPDAQIVKRAAGHYGAWQYGMFDPESTARQKVYNTFYSQLKTAIEDNSPEGVREINKQLSELIPVLNATIRRIPVAERNNALSLTDIIGLVGSAIEPRALGITMLNLLSKSGTAADILSKVGPRIGNAAPAVGAASAIVDQAYAPTTQPGQAEQPLSPVSSQNSNIDSFKDKYGMTEEEWKTKYGKYAEGAMGIGGTLGKVAPKALQQIAKRIHPEDAAIMRDLTAAAAKVQGYKPSAKEMIKLQRDAVTIWEKYLEEFELPATIRGMAHDFGRLLDYVKLP